MSIAELIEEIKTLPESRVAEVRDFVEFVKQKDAESAADQESDTSWFEKGEECPICAKHRDPVTGELRFNDEVMAGMQEVEDMISGKIPVKWHTSLEDLDKILGL
ncbi:MAG: DUF2281 domain-containing protein [Treponema sp.]|jgi:hypothetical protein|nr:DUF2281 domain-containing protein [Treponema sp.]